MEIKFNQPDTKLPKMKKVRVYTAFMTQEGTTPPDVTIMQNTIGDIVWTRQAAGQYYGTLTGEFINNKLWVVIDQNTGNASRYFLLQWQDVNRVVLWTNQGGVNMDGLLYETCLEIRLYE